MSQSLIQVIRDIEKTIPIYEQRRIQDNFIGIYAKGKLVSVVSNRYVLVQSRDLFKEAIMYFKDYIITRHIIKTNLRRHYLYLRFESPSFTEKFIAILINSVDKSNAIKFLMGVYEKICGNDLIFFHKWWIKHIGQVQQKLDLALPSNLIAILYEIQRRGNYLDNEQIEKLKKVVYLNEERINKLLVCPNLLEAYRYLTSLMPKRYNMAYFDKLHYLYNLLIEA